MANAITLIQPGHWYGLLVWCPAGIKPGRDLGMGNNPTSGDVSQAFCVRSNVVHFAEDRGLTNHVADYQSSYQRKMADRDPTIFARAKLGARR